jgi:hypothetical protein
VSQPDPPPTLPGLGISIVRTAVPYLWGLLLTWLLSIGIPADLVTTLEPVAALLVLVVGTVIYAGARALERNPRIPGWLSTVLLGSTRQPMYLHTPDPTGIYQPGQQLTDAEAAAIRHQLVNQPGPGGRRPLT